MSSGPLRMLTVAFVIVLVVVAGGMVLDLMVQSTGGTVDGESVTYQAATFSGDGVFVALNDGKGVDETVYKTTGHAVNLSGASDSYVESEGGFSIASDDNWTVSVWGYVDSGAPQEMAAVSANGRVAITLDRADSQWRGWYYDDGTTNSHTVNVSTSGNEVGNLTNVMVWHNGSHLSIYRNGTQGEMVETAGTGNVAPAQVSAANWDGRLEELRTFDQALNGSQRSSVVDNPVEQLPDASPTSRAMFDQPQRSTQLLLYTDTHLTQSNVTYSDGFSAQEMDGPNNLVGTDYRWENVGPQIAPVAGSELGGAPVAYVNYSFTSSGVSDMVDGWTNFAGLAEVAVIAIGLLMLMGYIGKLQS